ncbi:DUF4174 domain-containing protein [Loktanella agnita]|uniref:DUF4174 domain-containing protein n=1 Tax=Loktanella agnita TaxID=287097 RepID=UPI0039868392
MMKFLQMCGATVALLCGASAVAAQDLTVLEQWETDHTQVFDATDVTLAELQWIARPLVVFADTPNDPRFRQQMDLLTDRFDDLAERDVIVFADTDPDGASELRLRLRPRGYMMALVAKDGTVAFRKPSPWSVREITRSIDKMPLRQQEIEDRRLIGQ